MPGPPTEVGATGDCGRHEPPTRPGTTVHSSGLGSPLADGLRVKQSPSVLSPLQRTSWPQAPSPDFSPGHPTPADSLSPHANAGTHAHPGATVPECRALIYR